MGKGRTLLLKSYSGPNPTMETQQVFSKYFFFGGGAVWGFFAVVRGLLLLQHLPRGLWDLSSPARD